MAAMVLLPLVVVEGLKAIKRRIHMTTHFMTNGIVA
jgi:hypothetical protein